MKPYRSITGKNPDSMTAAARELGIDVSSLYRKIRSMNITPPETDGRSRVKLYCRLQYSSETEAEMRVSIVYDNTSLQENLAADWGFACLVEARGKAILFDTGARADILGQNMKMLRIDPSRIDAVFLSHDHWDHTGGLSAVPGIENLSVYVPGSFRPMPDLNGLHRIVGPAEVFDNIFSTGELKAIEHSLVIRQGKKVVVVAGCSHPGVVEILDAASVFGNPAALIGGLHGFDDFEQVAGLGCICPTHCTRHIDRIAARYPRQYVSGGAGRVLEL